jgi:hypothetical protein
MESIKKYNPSIKIEKDKEHLHFKNVWNDETFMIRLR